MKILIAINRELRPQIIGQRDYQRLTRLGEIKPVEAPAKADKQFFLAQDSAAEIILSSWGTGSLDTEVMAHYPRLRLLAHAAGSVKSLVSEALWKQDVRVTSAAAAIAYGVAEFCLGLILTTTKRVYWATAGIRAGKWKPALEVFGKPFEIYQQNIGIIGASSVGRHLVKLLHNFDCRIMLYDPYCSREKAQSLGVELVATLDDLFRQCRVVSLNAPSTEETRNMVRGRHFALLPDGAVFINTARGAIIHQDEMVAELRKGRFIACLDVTEPEPLPKGHTLLHLPNVLLTPHEAGAIAENRLRLGTFAVNEVEAFVKNQPLKYEVTQEMLARIG